jgi:E3 ubiquitin-protein ligase SHPRH
LQEISDSVADAEWEGDITTAIQACITERRDLEAKVNTNRARQRYLDHLVKNKEEGIADDDDDNDTCILCKYEFNRGYMTQWYVLMTLPFIPWLTPGICKVRTYFVKHA